MRTRMKWAAWGTTAAVSVAALTLPVQAQNNRGNQRDRSSESRETRLDNLERADRLIGRDVRNNDNEKIGDIKDLVVDLESGRALYAVVSVGGFLGMGDRLVAVPIQSLTARGNRLRLDADKQKVTGAPQFFDSGDREQEMLTPTFASGVYRHFGQSAWWQSDTGAASRPFGNVHKASDLIGMNVKNVSNATVGEVKDAVIDMDEGRVAFVILDPDNSLNLKNNLYALPPNALTAGADRSSLTGNVDRSKLASGPHFAEGDWPNFSNRSWASRVYQHYGKQAYFESGALRPTSGRTNSTGLYHEPGDAND